MANEKEKIIAMLEEGKITAEDAAKLLAALGGDDKGEAHTARPVNPELKGKKLRVKVEGGFEEMESMNVNVSVPLSLAKLADNIIANVVPKEVNKELESEGINLKNLNIGEIIEKLSDLDEDVVNVDMEKEGKPLKVRVYVE